MKIITTAAIKGGTGKTTTAAALLQAGAADGKKVLGIDADPQSNLTMIIGADGDRPGCYDVITGDTTAAEAVQQTAQGVDIIAGSPDLATLKTRAASAKRLQQALEPIKGNYDLIVIDTPPQMGETTFNALQASTGLVIPIAANILGLQGMYTIADIAREIMDANKGLSFTGVILTQFDARPKFYRFMRDTIKEKAEAEGIPYLGEVRGSVSVVEAQANAASLFDYAPKSKPAQDYRAIYEKIMKGDK